MTYWSQGTDLESRNPIATMPRLTAMVSPFESRYTASTIAWRMNAIKCRECDLQSLEVGWFARYPWSLPIHACKMPRATIDARRPLSSQSHVLVGTLESYIYRDCKHTSCFGFDATWNIPMRLWVLMKLYRDLRASCCLQECVSILLSGFWIL